MTMRNRATTGPTEQRLVITRIFDAPRELVFKAWTYPKHLARWWGPNGFDNPVCEIDARPGGAILMHMRGPDGVIYPTRGVFHEIVAPERLVMATWGFEDEAGNPQLEAHNTVTFAIHESGKTKLTLQTVIVKAAAEVTAMLAGMEEGWNESLDRLAMDLKTSQGETSMADNAPSPVSERMPTPDPALRRLDILVGTWNVAGEAQGQVRYEWMEGGFFLLQHVDLEHSGRRNKGFEVIGRERLFGASEPSADIKSRFYDTEGNTFDYVYELEGDTLTIWGGEKGSPAFYKGRLSEDGNTLAGHWVWPGGGYESTATRAR